MARIQALKTSIPSPRLRSTPRRPWRSKLQRPEDEADSGEDEADAEDGEDDAPKKGNGKFLLSGFVDKQKELGKKGAIIDIPRNDGGRVILYSFNPMHRYLNHGDHNYVFNALLNWNDFPDAEPKDHPRLLKD